MQVLLFNDLALGEHQVALIEEHHRHLRATDALEQSHVHQKQHMNAQRAGIYCYLLAPYLHPKIPSFSLLDASSRHVGRYLESCVLCLNRCMPIVV